MKKHVVYSCFMVLMTLCSCNERGEISFYHWKARAKYTEACGEALELSEIQKIYLHYFDIKQSSDEALPIYILKNVDEEYKGFEIVPVIYITNEVFKHENLVSQELAKKVAKLIDEISLRHFGREIREIQVDCDWTQSTRSAYFNLLRDLGSEFEIDATIRLHQIKFMQKTGVPPVNKGTLMLYNVGDLKNKQQNSILEASIVKQYINAETSYPLPLNIGLPLFSQTVLFNNDDRVKIIKDTDRFMLENDRHFVRRDELNFEVVCDTLYKGYYLSKGYHLKVEEVDEREIVTSYKIIKKSELITDEIILYHLDDASLSNIDLNELIDKL